MGVESEYLTWLSQQSVANRLSDGRIGIGDDAAIIQSEDQTIVWCTDTIVQNVHFHAADDRTWWQAGRKSLAVNLSDIAAMGARAQYATLSLVVNRTTGLVQAKAITKGLIQLAESAGVDLIGGDTCTSDGPVVITVALGGRLIGPGPILRSTARPDDRIVVTGEFGGSLSGKHWNFEPRCREIEEILEHVTPSSLTDASDGLARDLHAIVDASQCGALVRAEDIPISDVAKSEATGKDQDSRPNQQTGKSEPPGLWAALNDGEDFELIMTLDPDSWLQLQQKLNQGKLRSGCRLTEIGRITERRSVQIQFADGSREQLPAGGYDH